MSAVVLAFPDRRGNRPAPINPAVDVVTQVRAYCWKLGLNSFDRHAVMRAVQHWQQLNFDDNTVSSRGMAMANRLYVSHQPDGPSAA